MRLPLPYFSVIITTYNRGALIGRAIQSLIVQTCSDWEGIIIDDGSTDDSKEVISKYLAANSRITCYYEPAQGATPAKNNGMRLSRGKYIAFLDSDDEYTPDYLEERKQFLDENPDVDFLYGGVRLIGDPYLPDMHHPGKKVHIDNCTVGGTFVIARSLYQTFGGFSEMPLGSDADYLQRLQKTDFRIARMRHRGYIYHRETSNSITNNLLRYGWTGAGNEG